jgi:uncharacterized protein YbaP (TraB family)
MRERAPHGLCGAVSAAVLCAAAVFCSAMPMAQAAAGGLSGPAPGQLPGTAAAHAPAHGAGWAHPGAHPGTQQHTVKNAVKNTAHSASGPVTQAAPRMPFYVARKGSATIYLLGTLHLGRATDYPARQPFRAPVVAALDASPTMAFELSPDDLVVSQDDVTRYGVCKDACLPRLLPQSLWRKLAFRLRGNPAALAEIRHMRPWLASLLVETYSSLSAGLQTEYGSEAQLENFYTAGRIVGLETLHEQMRAFTSLSLAQQREMLAQDLVQTPAENVADVRALYKLWRVGDADALAAWQAAKSEMLTRNPRLSASIDEKILYRRNGRFVARMLPLAKPGQPLFVAIGALHLGGRRGVLEHLREHGFTVVSN